MSSKNTFKLLFYINKAKQNKDGVPIMLRITINGENVSMNIRRRIQLHQWDSRSRMPKNTDSFTDDLYLYIECMRNKAYSAFTELTRMHDDVTPHMIRNCLQGIGGGVSKTIVELWAQHNDEIKKLIGKQNSHTLWQKHNSALNHFKDFIRGHYRMSDMPIKQVRYNVIREFHTFLMIEKIQGYNTSIKVLQMLKKITQRAIKSDWLKVDPFLDFKLSLKEVERPYLTDEELKKIQDNVFSVPRLNFVKDLFLFACYTGLSYSDIRKLHRAEIEHTKNGLWWIKTLRQKTKQKSHIPLFNQAKLIIDKYCDLESMKPTDKILPVLSNQKLNAYLKEIAHLCGIHKNLTFHVARHTFATTVTLQNGVSIESVSRMLGHSNLKSTQHYARIVDKKIENDMIQMTKNSGFTLAS